VSRGCTFHHVHQLPRAILDLPAAVGVPVRLHAARLLRDLPAIPSRRRRTAAIAASPDAAGCGACLARVRRNGASTSARGGGGFGKLCAAPIGSSRHRATSLSASRRYFPALPIAVWPHPEPPPPPAPRVLRVVILGNLSPEKGLYVAAACAQDARDRRLPMTFRVLGSTTEPVLQWP
jgi:hypothetical protein